MACSVLGGYVAGLIAGMTTCWTARSHPGCVLLLAFTRSLAEKFALRRDGDPDAGIKPGAGALRGIYREQAKGSGPSCRGDSIKLISPGRQLCAAPSGAPLLL